MYLDFFCLQTHPFQVAPDYHFLYLSRQHARAMAYMKYTVANHEGFAVISGEIGSGKTTLVQKFLAELDDEVVVIRINQSLLNAIEFLQTVTCGLGIDTPKSDKVGLQRQIREKIAHYRDEDRNVLLLVDDAQNLADEVLEDIRLLSDSENEQGSTLSVILIGQPELESRLKQHSLRQLDQRIRLRFRLGPLSEEETDLYIQYRLRLAGWEGTPLFESDISYEVYRYTQGVPRLINILCDSILLNAFVDSEKRLSTKLVENAAHDLEWNTTGAPSSSLTNQHFFPQHLVLPEDSALATPNLPLLMISTAEGYIDTYPLREPIIRLGRISKNELQLAHPTVGEFHAVIISTDKSYYLVDLESEGNATTIEGKAITRHLLTDGLQFVIGPYHCKFTTPKQPDHDNLDTNPTGKIHTGKKAPTRPSVVASN